VEAALSVAKGPKFRRHNSKGAAESGGPEKLAAEFLTDLQKRAEKGQKCFKTFVSVIICVSFGMNLFLIQLFPHIFLQFISFQLIFFCRQQVSMKGRMSQEISR
jgi:hypothetical protein